MTWKIVHLYPDGMSLYGEYANLVILTRMLEGLGDQVEITRVLGEDTPDFAGAHLIYMGCGTEQAQKWAMGLLQPHREELAKALEEGAILLFTGNAMEILGQTITDRKGKVWQGLGLGEFTTIETNQRPPHDVIANPTLWQEPTVGFMNKCSLTADISTPLFSGLEMGFGNDKQRGPEGYAQGNILATHLTGPVLVKNPAFAHYLLRRLLEGQGREVGETLPTLPHQEESYQVTLKELRENGEGRA